MILVTDGEQRSSLAVVRSLGRAGYDVAVCSTRARPLSGASRYCAATYLVQDPTTDRQGFSRALKQLVEAHGVQLIIPMTDVAAPSVLGLRDQCPHVIVPFPPLETYEAISDKGRLLEVARERGVPTPEQIVIESPEQGASLRSDDRRLDRLTWPLIVKPARSAVRVGDGVRKVGVGVASNWSSLIADLRRYPREAYPILVQERITGPGLGAFVLADEGKILASFAHRRIREKPPTGGVSVYRESVAMPPVMREYSERILTAFGWTGVAMLEFKQDASTGIPYLMEVNGRFWGSLQLAVDAGVDFPLLLVRRALGEPIQAAPDYREGVRSRWLWGDIDHLIWMLRAPRDYRSAHPFLPSRLGALGRFLVPWRPGDRYEVLKARDPRPFLRESAEWLRQVLISGRA